MNRPAQDIRFCTSRDGTRIAFAVCGEGPALIRAGHSFSHLEHEWDCVVWRPFLDVLCRQHTLVRYDMRGTGLSDRDGLEFTFERYVEDLEAVVTATGLKHFSMLGMTGGGALAVTYAVRHPQQVSRLVLFGAYLLGRTARSRTKEQREETELVLRLIELGWGQDSPTFQQLFTYQFLPEGSAEQLRAFNELMRHSAFPNHAALLLRAWFGADITNLAPLVRTPTLVLHACGDLRIPYDQGRSLAASIPGARFVSLDSRNHIVLEQEPAWQQLVAELDAFLLAPAPVTRAPSLDGLTTREQAVMGVLLMGLNTPDMAERLGISEKTLRNHLSTIYSKLGVSNRAQAIIFARDAGLMKS